MARTELEKQAPTSSWVVTRVSAEGVEHRPDVLAREEPLKYG